MDLGKDFGYEFGIFFGSVIHSFFFIYNSLCKAFARSSARLLTIIFTFSVSNVLIKLELQAKKLDVSSTFLF